MIGRQDEVQVSSHRIGVAAWRWWQWMVNQLQNSTTRCHYLSLFWNPVENTLHGSSFHQPWDQNTTSQPVFGQDFQPGALNSNVSKAEMQYACFIFVCFTFTLSAFSRRCYPNWHTIVVFNCLNTFRKLTKLGSLSQNSTHIPFASMSN